MMVEYRDALAGSSGMGRMCAVRSDGTKKQLVGYAAKFYNAADAGTIFELAPSLVERIAPGCFDRALRERDDVRALFNHDPNFVLGRRSAGTLQLSADRVGLAYTVDLPDSVFADAVMASIARGDVTGSSFAFQVLRENWIISQDPDLPDVRELCDVQLLDVSAVTYPAYGASSAGLRQDNSRAALLRRWQSAVANSPTKRRRNEADYMRLRLAEAF